MEKPIEEKYSGLWRMFWVYFSVVLVALLSVVLVCSIIFWIKGISPWKNLLDSLEAIALLPSGVGILLFIRFFLNRKEKRQRSGWLLRDDGLLCIYSSGEKDLMTWKEIQNLKWTGFLGLLLEWNDSKNQEIKKFLLGVEEIDAKELISIWRQKKQ
jgi:hypothetical protein